MTETDEDLKQALRQWRVPAPDDDLADRLIAQALSGPRQKPWQRALTEWRYALGYKLAAAGACAALGLGIGIAAAEPLDIAAMALMAGIGG